MSNKDDITHQALKIETHDICPNCGARLDQTQIHFVYRTTTFKYKCFVVYGIHTGEK